jgi:hypothetical protein
MIPATPQPLSLVDCNYIILLVTVLNDRFIVFQQSRLSFNYQDNIQHLSITLQL